MLRPYQILGLNLIRASFQRGVRKVLLKLSTGAGKTVIFCEVLIQTSAKGNRAGMVVRGKQLVEQASQRLFKEGVSHGVRQANHWNKNYGALVQICSIDTLIARGEFPDFDVLVIDEADLFVSPKCKEFISYYNERGTYILSVTATPFTKEPLTHLADEVICPITFKELVDQGYLLPPKYFAPSIPNLAGVRTSKGDFVNEQLEERMSVLTGDIVDHWKNLGENRPTLCFAVNIKHSMSIAARFNAAGITAEHIEGNHSLEERYAAIESLKKGEIKVICNVGVFSVGADIPFLSCIIQARPTKSYRLCIQQWGRGTRLSPETGKKDFLILDHAGNTLRHGFMHDEPEVELEGIKVNRKSPQIQRCENCLVVYEGPSCHVCGFTKHVAPPIETSPNEDNDILAELKDLPKGAEISLFIRRQKELAKRRGYKPKFVYYRVAETYGEEIADQAFPKQANSNRLPAFLRRS